MAEIEKLMEQVRAAQLEQDVRDLFAPGHVVPVNLNTTTILLQIIRDLHRENNKLKGRTDERFQIDYTPKVGKATRSIASVADYDRLFRPTGRPVRRTASSVALEDDWLLRAAKAVWRKLTFRGRHSSKAANVSVRGEAE